MMKINYTIPTTKEEITLEKYLEYAKLIQQDDVEASFLTHRCIEIFCNIPLKQITKFKQSDIDEILSILTPILTTNYPLENTFTFKGIEYGLIPNFSKDLLVGEFMDLDVYRENNDFIRMMSILYRPLSHKKGTQYLIEPYKETHTEFNELPFHYFTSVSAFFLTLLEQLVEITNQFSQHQLQQIQDFQTKATSMKTITDTFI